MRHLRQVMEETSHVKANGFSPLWQPQATMMVNMDVLRRKMEKEARKKEARNGRARVDAPTPTHSQPASSGSAIPPNLFIYPVEQRGCRRSRESSPVTSPVTSPGSSPVFFSKGSVNKVVVEPTLVKKKAKKAKKD